MDKYTRFVRTALALANKNMGAKNNSSGIVDGSKILRVGCVGFLQCLDFLKNLRSFRTKSLEFSHVRKFDVLTAIFLKIQA
jgi:hypothetical protein